MDRISVSSIIKNYHEFSRDFWLSYKALERVMDSVRFNEIKLNLMKSKRIDDKYLKEVNQKQFEYERKQIDEEWTKENEEAKVTGTAVHEYLHKLLTSNIEKAKSEYNIPTDEYIIYQTDKFLNTDKGIFSEFKMEIPIDEFLLVGIADLIIKDGNHIKIIEFKSDKKIDFKSRFDVSKKKTKRLKYPLSKFEDCSGTHYQIQLSLYAWMLKQLNPDFIIDELVIYHIKGLKKIKEYPLDYLEETIDMLINYHIKSLRIKKEMEKCNLIKY